MALESNAPEVLICKTKTEYVFNIELLEDQVMRLDWEARKCWLDLQYLRGIADLEFFLLVLISRALIQIIFSHALRVKSQRMGGLLLLHVLFVQ
jgi:hypothetical protein